MSMLNVLIALALAAALSPLTEGKVRKNASSFRAKTKFSAVGSKGKSKRASANSKGRTAFVARAKAPRQSSPSTERYIQIQKALADKGFYNGPVNGDWGPDSVAALRRFQESQNLKPDGRLGALSLISLGLGPKHETIAVE